MLSKPEYRRLVQCVRQLLDQQKGEPFVSVTAGFCFQAFAASGPVHRRLSIQEADAVWACVVRELGLVVDETATQLWTLPGRGVPQEWLAEDKHEIDVAAGPPLAASVNRPK